MNRGEFFTRAAIWLALGAYATGAGMLLLARGRRDWRTRARWAWTIGCAFFLMHVVCAFNYFHDWSHAAAYRETARQTAAVTGWHWGGGLFINYAFAMAWLADVVWWWCAPATRARRPAWLTGLWHGFFFFMVFNGAVVFAHGPMRWLGLFICAGLAVLWWRMRWAETAARAPC